MKRYSFTRLALCVLCGASLALLAPGLATAGWVWQNSGIPNSTFYSVHFPVDAQTGYAVGCDYSWVATIVKTMDGGSMWFSLTSGQRGNLNSVHFPVDVSTGYAVGADTGVNQQPLILKTTDGGATWVRQTCGIMGYLYSVHFPVDAQTGYAVGRDYSGYGFILKTTNGGGNWVAQISGSPNLALNSVHFPVDASTGYAAGAWTIRKTVNGGTNWGTQSSGTRGTLNSVHFPVDASTGYVAGGSDLDSFALIKKTTDGGGSWFTVFQSTRLWSGLMEVQFPVDAQTGYAVGLDSILKTTNGGANWISQPTGTANRLYSVYFPVDAQTGYAVGGSGVILKTMDGGTIGVEEENKGFEGPRVQGFKITPNPFTSFATLPGHEAERFSLYDISGRKVGTYRGDRVGEGLAPGVYFLRSSDGKDKPLRIVKVR